MHSDATNCGNYGVVSIKPKQSTLVQSFTMEESVAGTLRRSSFIAQHDFAAGETTP